ncbi:MAG: hypothetical protein ABIN67_09945 [Ferruginibacter sp.]
METFDPVRNFWQKNTEPQSSASPLTKEDVEKVIRARIKKEKKIVAEFFWAALAFQIFLYSFASYLFIRFWGDPLVIGLCAAGALLYIPFTIKMMQKFKAMYKPVTDTTVDVQSLTSKQYGLLTQFFRFKKGFDLVAIPVNSLVVVGVLIQIYMPGGIEANLTQAIIGFVIMMLVYATAAWYENNKHFVKPLRQFQLILEDMKKSD